MTKCTKSESVALGIASLELLLGNRLSISRAVRDQHCAGEGLRGLAAPDAVAFPANTEEVAAIVRICVSHNIAMTPYGAGTSLEGHLQSPAGGISIDLSQMNAIVEVNNEDLDCRVEAGVTREALNDHLRTTGLFFPIDPGANATLGGMSATRASGTNAVRYGTMRDVVLGLTVVTPQGEIIRTGTRARKTSAGYDLTRLFIGSEGTLGIITEIQLRLFGIPEVMAAATCQFADLRSATETVMLAIQIGIPLARIELMDALQVEACIRYSKLTGLEPKPTLFFEFHGSKASVAEQVQQVEEISRDFGGSAFAWSDTVEGRNALWKARHQAYYAARALQAGSEAFSTDACVPISRLADVMMQAQALADESGLICPIVGHVGDGNFHVFILHNPDVEEECILAEKLSLDIARSAIHAGGTCTGEHGIGRHKLGLLVEEHGPAVDVMRQIKRSLDPANLFNPGSTVPL